MGKIAPYSFLLIFFCCSSYRGSGQQVDADEFEHLVGLSTNLIHYEGNGFGPSTNEVCLSYFKTKSRGFYTRPSASFGIGQITYFRGTEFNGKDVYSPYTTLKGGYTLGYNGKYLGFKFINEIGPFVYERTFEVASVHKVKFNTGYFLKHLEVSLGAPILFLVYPCFHGTMEHLVLSSMI